MPTKKPRDVIKCIVKDEVSQMAQMGVGEILKTYYKPVEYGDEQFNLPLADIKMLEDGVNEERIVEEVPIINNSLATNIDGTKVKKGDRVIVSFYGSNKLYPFITGRKYINPTERAEEMKTIWGVNVADVYGYY